MPASPRARLRGAAGQTTAEYALVILAAAALSARPGSGSTLIARAASRAALATARSSRSTSAAWTNASKRSRTTGNSTATSAVVCPRAVRERRSPTGMWRKWNAG